MQLWLVVELSNKIVGGSTSSGVFALNLQRQRCETVLELDTSWWQDMQIERS